MCWRSRVDIDTNINHIYISNIICSYHITPPSTHSNNCTPVTAVAAKVPPPELLHGPILSHQTY